MKRLKHILIVTSLLLASLPCLHAEEHERHGHADADGKSMCAAPLHSGSCHDCDETICDLKTHKLHVTSGQSLAVTTYPVPLFILSEVRLVIRQPDMSPHGALSSLQTIRLLI